MSWARAAGLRVAKNAAAIGLPLAEKTAKNHAKSHTIGFFGAVSSRSGHRSVGDRSTWGRGRFKTLDRGSGPWDPSLCVVRVSRRDAVSGKNRAVGREIWQGPSQPPRRARAGVGRGNRRARSGPMPRQATFPAWPFLGPAASFAAGSSARRLVERNGARQRRAAQASAAHPRGRPFLK